MHPSQESPPRRRARLARLAPVILLLGAAACGRPDAGAADASSLALSPVVLVVRDTTYTRVVDVAGRVEAFTSAVLSTKVAGTVNEVLVREGDRVPRGRTLARLDVRDLDARQEQVAAAIAGAASAQREAELHATRMRALFADSAATRSQLDAAEAGLARAEAALRAARASQAEVGAVRDYGEIRAPFAGTVVERLVDPGAFAAPGVPLLRVEDASRLRVVAAVTPEVASRLSRGDRLRLTIEGREATGVVEGIVPVSGTALQSVNVIVDNSTGVHLTGSAARLAIPAGDTAGVLVPRAFVRAEGDLTGVQVFVAGRVTVRWIRLGRDHGDLVEVLSGLSAGDSLVVPLTAAGA
ncbi:MAG TPA: efflux RND transporter periplasmic adaptor subunit [Gemmatimonadaceae bacterium]|nr:efflux RND transporter periplasmic adaptor subunit [Gemmatimonadaceae bacterium]